MCVMLFFFWWRADEERILWKYCWQHLAKFSGGNHVQCHEYSFMTKIEREPYTVPVLVGMKTN